MIKSLEIQNVRVFTKKDLEFTKGSNFIFGPNGGGKSTVIESLLFAFFGSPSLRTVKEEAIRDVSKEAFVSLHCDFPPLGIINVTRSLSSSKSELTTKVHHITSGSQITKFFTKLFVSSPKLFQTTFVAKQKEVDLLAKLDRAKRRDLLTELLGLDILDTMLKTLTSEVREYKTLPDITSLRDQITQLEIEVGDFDFNTLLHIRQLQSELQRAPETDVKDKLAKLEEIHNTLQSMCGSLQTKITLYELALKELSHTCPLCNSQLTTEQVEEFKNRIDSLHDQFTQSKQLLSKVADSLSKLRILSTKRTRDEVLKELGSHKDLDTDKLIASLNTLERKRELLSLYSDIDIDTLQSKRELKEVLSEFRLKCLQKFFTEITIQVTSLLQECSRFSKCEIDESLDIIVDGRTLSSFSGGETDLICTILRICISKYMAYLRFGYIPLLILDSCFDSLDKEKAQGVVTALESDSSFGQIIMTGHRELDVVPGTNIIRL